MNEFPVTTLKKVISPIERPVAPVPGQQYRQIGVQLWGRGAYERESLDGSQTKYKTFFRVEKDDIIVNKIWARNGSVAVVPDSLAGCYASGEFPIFSPVIDKLEPRWFHWLTKTASFWAQCDEKSRGTSGKNRIRPEAFLEIGIPLPPVTEQRRIVARIEEVSAKIEESYSLRQSAKEAANASIHSTAQKLLSKVSSSITPLSSWLDRSRDGIQTGPFGAQLGSSDFTDVGVPVLTIGNIQFSGILTDKLKYISEKKAALLRRYRISKGDILFARMGTVGRCCVVPEESENWLINYHIIRVALDTSRTNPRYIHWTIRASLDVELYLNEKTRGATRQGVNSKIVGDLPCRIPSLQEQNKIVAFLDALQAKVDAVKKLQQESEKELNALMPSILSKAFAGEL